VMMERDIKNMTLNEYLMYEGRHKDLERSYTSRKRVASERNRVLVYPYSDDEAEDGKEVDIDSMTLDEYDLYMAMQYSKKSDVHDTTHGFTSEFFVQSPQTPNLPLDKKDSSFGEILYDLFRMGAKNLRRMEHEVPNRCNEETVRDTNHESGNLFNFPTFPVTNEFASVCIQDEENINVSTTEEIEEVLIEDVEIDEDHDVDHSKTKEAL
ncbi:hypothetical protein Tco_1425272, partial [Tanacetum coccineum]